MRVSAKLLQYSETVYMTYSQIIKREGLRSV